MPFKINFELSFNFLSEIEEDNIYVVMEKTTMKQKLALVPSFDIGSYNSGILYISERDSFTYSSRKHFKENYYILRKVTTINIQ